MGEAVFDLERIRAIPILAVAKDLGFKLSGSGGGRCRLPGHDDTTPSFAARAATNRFVCFACNRRGSVIDLVEMMHGVGFVDACHWLEARYLGGSQTTGRSGSGRVRTVMPRPKAEEASVIEAKTHTDVEVFGWILDRSPLSPSGEQYLASRGFRPATLVHFRVGQLGNCQDLLHAATAKWGRERLVACGLLKEARWGDELVFPSNYLLFPFLVDDNVTYLQARRPDSGRTKRWYCPSSLPPPLFNGDALSTAKRTITLCEGVTDVISAFELDMDAVGLLGTSSRLDGETVARFLGRNLAIVGDEDEAGRDFARRMSSLFAPHGLTIVRKRLPAGCNDLNDYLIATRKVAHELA